VPRQGIAALSLRPPLTRSTTQLRKEKTKTRLDFEGKSLQKG